MTGANGGIEVGRVGAAEARSLLVPGEQGRGVGGPTCPRRVLATMAARASLAGLIVVIRLCASRMGFYWGGKIRAEASSEERRWVNSIDYCELGVGR